MGKKLYIGNLAFGIDNKDLEELFAQAGVCESAAVITDRAVMRFDAAGEAFLASRHPGSSVEEIQADTGWELANAAAAPETEPPAVYELNQLRDIDREGFWSRRDRTGAGERDE